MGQATRNSVKQMCLEQLLHQQEQLWKQESRDRKDWLLIFPEALPIVEKQQKQLKKQIEYKTIEGNNLVIRFLIRKTEKFSEAWIREQMEVEQIKQDLAKLQKKYFYNNAMLSHLPTRNRRHESHGVTQEQIDQAKQVPLETFLTTQNLRRAGTHRQICRCPFHDEKTASFVIYENDNTYHCFGCQAHGDVISLYQKLFNESFVSTVKHLTNA